MIRRPPRSTRTDTLFPYTTLFRSCPDPCYGGRIAFRQGCSSHGPGSAPERLRLPAHHRRQCQPLEEGVPPCVSAVRDRPAPRPPARRDKGCCIPQASTGSLCLLSIALLAGRQPPTFVPAEHAADRKRVREGKSV